MQVGPSASSIIGKLETKGDYAAAAVWPERKLHVTCWLARPHKTLGPTGIFPGDAVV